MTRILLLSFLGLLTNALFAQSDTLPKFNVTKKKNVITISWKNPYDNTIQLNIQRSKDSNRNYITIHSCPLPHTKSYSYVDQTAKNDSSYYRIFILFDGATYLFTRPQRPQEDTRTTTQEPPPVKPAPVQETKKPTPAPSVAPVKTTEPAKPSPTVQTTPEKPAPVITPAPQKKKEELYLPDSIRLIPVTILRVPLKKQDPSINFAATLSVPRRKPWQPSPFVYTGDDGNIVIDLPLATQKKYSILFAREEGRPLFQIPEIREPKMTLDKAVFLRSGWYHFELREDGKVIERNKFLITRDY